MTLVEFIKMQPDYIGSNGRTEEAISKAEKELGIEFAKDYREYLKEIGIASIEGHEFTGLTKNPRLDVVSVTKERREMMGAISVSWYVVEEIGLDGIVVWQDSDGFTYETSPYFHERKVAQSLMEYIMLS